MATRGTLPTQDGLSVGWGVPRWRGRMEHPPDSVIPAGVCRHVALGYGPTHPSVQNRLWTPLRGFSEVRAHVPEVVSSGKR